MSDRDEWPAPEDPEALEWMERQNVTASLFAGWARNQGVPGGVGWFERARARFEAEDDALDLSPKEIARRLRVWAVGHNTVHGILDRYAGALGLDMSTPEGEAGVRAAYDADLRAGASSRRGNPNGRPRKDRPDDAELHAECEAERATVQRAMSATEAARIVARRHGLSAAHVMKVTRPYRSG